MGYFTNIAKLYGIVKNKRQEQEANKYKQLLQQMQLQQMQNQLAQQEINLKYLEPMKEQDLNAKKTLNEIRKQQLEFEKMLAPYKKQQLDLDINNKKLQAKLYKQKQQNDMFTQISNEYQVPEYKEKEYLSTFSKILRGVYNEMEKLQKDLVKIKYEITTSEGKIPPQEYAKKVSLYNKKLALFNEYKNHFYDYRDRAFKLKEINNAFRSSGLAIALLDNKYREGVKKFIEAKDDTEINKVIDEYFNPQYYKEKYNKSKVEQNTNFETLNLPPTAMKILDKVRQKIFEYDRNISNSLIDKDVIRQEKNNYIKMAVDKLINMGVNKNAIELYLGVNLNSINGDSDDFDKSIQEINNILKNLNPPI